LPDSLTSALDEIRVRQEKIRAGQRLPDPDAAVTRMSLVLAARKDTPRLLAAVDAVLARHVPKTVTVTRLCGAHHRIVIPDCPDCVKRQVTTCAACDPVCPDDNTWPCADYLAISRALTGEDGTDG